MSRGRLIRAALGAALAVGALFLPVASGGASSGVQIIRVQDFCEPNSFNAAVGPGTCLRDPTVNQGKRVTFGEFIGALSDNPAAILEGRDHKGWRFAPDQVTVEQGETLDIQNRGFEFHTFTGVGAFGGGCIPPLNGPFGFGLGPNCGDANVNGTPDEFEVSGVAAGAGLTVSGLSVGTHLFQCFVHPWMRTTVEVEAD